MPRRPSPRWATIAHRGRIAGMLSIALFLLGGTACGGRHATPDGSRAVPPASGPASTTPAAATLTADGLQAALLTLDALPSGWQVREAPRTTSFSAEPGQRKLAQASVSFHRGPVVGGSSVVHDLILFRPGEAPAYLAEVRAYLRAQQIMLPAHGDESFATRDRVSDAAHTTVRFALWVRHGDLISVLVHVDDAAPAAVPTAGQRLFERLADLSERRLSLGAQAR